MAVNKYYKMSVQERSSRRFSESFKRAKVLEIETGKTRISEVCREYEVNNTNVHRWIRKFGSRNKQIRTMVETDSDTKKLLELKKKVAELEQIVGQKQILIDFQAKMIDLAEEEYRIDIKKKFSIKPSGTSGINDPGIPSR
ncbi:transposase [Sphingobacterium hungaricum]